MNINTSTNQDTMLIRIIAVCFILGFTVRAHSQTINLTTDNIRWNATGFTDLITNAAANDAPCKFITYGNQTVDWIQADGTFVTSFTATSMTGSWSDPGTNGSITIGLSAGSLTGQLEISRSDQGITAVLTINGGTVAIRNSYTISSFEKL